MADVPDTGVDDTADSGETGESDTGDTDTDHDTGDTAVDTADSGDTADTGDTGGEDTAGSEPTPGLWAGEFDLGDDALILQPEHAGDYLGWSLEVGGDADGDGRDDLVNR